MSDRTATSVAARSNNKREPSTIAGMGTTSAMSRRSASGDPDSHGKTHHSLSRFSERQYAFRHNYSRHPIQVTERRGTPYATDADDHHHPPGASNSRMYRRGIRNGGDRERGSGNVGSKSNNNNGAAGRQPGRSSTIHDPMETTGGAPSSSRELARAASQADTLGLRNQKSSAKVGIAPNNGARGASDAGYDRRCYRAPVPASAVKGVWGGAERGTGPHDRTDTGMMDRRGGRGWSRAEHGGGELSPTLRWSDHPASSVGKSGREGGTVTRNKGQGYSAVFRASPRLERL